MQPCHHQMEVSKNGITFEFLVMAIYCFWLLNPPRMLLFVFIHYVTFYLASWCIMVWMTLWHLICIYLICSPSVNIFISIIWGIFRRIKPILIYLPINWGPDCLNQLGFIFGIVFSQNPQLMDIGISNWNIFSFWTTLTWVWWDMEFKRR